MRYRLYIYNTKAVTGDAPAIRGINYAVSVENDWSVWRRTGAASSLEEFDVKEIKRRIELELGDKCRVEVKYPMNSFEQVGYLYVCTSYEMASAVLPRVHMIVAEHGLALYDAEKERSFYLDLVDSTFLKYKMREQAIKNHILASDKMIWSFKKLSSDEDGRDKESTYVVTLRKEQGISFKERVEKFYNTLREALIEGEELVCENECFTICGRWYSIIYCLEGYKKHACMRGFFEHGKASENRLCRMSCHEAFKWMKGCNGGEREDIMSRMHFGEMKSAYKNPADRFVKSVNITKQQRRELFDII